MTLTREQTLLFASLGLSAAFAIGALFGAAVTPQHECSSVTSEAKAGKPQPVNATQHYWHDDSSTPAPSKFDTANKTAPTPHQRLPWNHASRDADPDSTLDCVSAPHSAKQYCWPKDISPLAGPK